MDDHADTAPRERARRARELSSALRKQAADLHRQLDESSASLAARLGRKRGRPLGDEGTSFTLRLACLPANVGLARHSIRRWLDGNGVPADASADVVLAVSEAAANAVEHPQHLLRRVIDVHAVLRDAAIEVVVRDSGRWKAEETRLERGRGLQIIRRLMDDVRIVDGHGGTVIVMRRTLDRVARG